MTTQRTKEFGVKTVAGGLLLAAGKNEQSITSDQRPATSNKEPEHGQKLPQNRRKKFAQAQSVFFYQRPWAGNRHDGFFADSALRSVRAELRSLSRESSKHLPGEDRLRARWRAYFRCSR